MPSASRVKISDARQKIESAKIAKRVAVKLSQSRAKVRISQPSSRWVNSRPRPQSRIQLNNRRLMPNVVNRLSADRQRLQIFPVNTASNLVVRKALEGIRRRPKNNDINFQNRIGRRRNFDNFSITRTNNRVLNTNRSRNNNNFDQIRKRDDNIHMIRRTIQNDRLEIKTSPKNKVVYRGKPTSVTVQRSGFSTGNDNDTGNGRPFLGGLKTVEDRREEAMEGVTFAGSPPSNMAPCSSSSVFSRLSSGSGVKTSSNQQPGFKLHVTNLNNSVSDEDIRELFGSVGDLFDSRLIKAGEAYAVFSKLEDAKRAIAEFNNRELDGVPMKITLVNAVQKTATNSSLANSPATSQNAKPLSFHSAKSRQLPPSKNETIEVDRDLITQALFSDASTANGHKQSPTVQFTVKI